MAGPYASEPQELVFVDSVDVFEAAEFSTGRLPDGSPVQVEFKLVSHGGLDYDMAADSELVWPPALTQSIHGRPGEGFVSFLTDLRLEAWVYVDINIWNVNILVWSDGLYLLDEAAFDPLLLPGAATPSVALESDGLGIDTIRYDIALFTGVSLQFTLDAFPRATATLSGLRLDTFDPTEPDDILATIDAEGDTAMFAIPDDEPGRLALGTTWTGRLTSALAVVFRPAVAVGTPIGSFDIASFDLPVNLTSYDGDRALTVGYEHPLPALATPFPNHDFGDHDVGDIANLSVPLRNDGLLDLEGTARIDGGDGLFSVFPNSFSAAPGIEDGVVVTYLAADEGDHTAILVIESNDPRTPVLEIPLHGGAVAIVEDPGLDPGGETVAVKTCGCASGEGSGAWVGGVGAAALLLRRRRG